MCLLRGDERRGASRRADHVEVDLFEGGAADCEVRQFSHAEGRSPGSELLHRPRGLVGFHVDSHPMCLCLSRDVRDSCDIERRKGIEGNTHPGLGTAAEFEMPKGGIFLWVKLPDSVDTTRLFQVVPVGRMRG